MKQKYHLASMIFKLDTDMSCPNELGKAANCFNASSQCPAKGNEGPHANEHNTLQLVRQHINDRENHFPSLQQTEKQY